MCWTSNSGVTNLFEPVGYFIGSKSYEGQTLSWDKKLSQSHIISNDTDLGEDTNHNSQ